MRIKQILSIVSTFFAGIVLCSTTQLVVAQPLDAAKAMDRLKKARPDFEFGPILKSEIPGLIKTTVVDGPSIYITPDGGHFFAGGLFEVQDDRIVDLAEKAMEDRRKAEIAKIKNEDMIIFGSEKSDKKAVYVFTDVDCYYCQKLHLEVAELNDLGIEVRYLAFPRKGLDSPGYRKIASAWCSDDTQQALTDLKAGKSIDDNVCQPNPVAAQYNLGGLLGVRGTPALVTEEGMLMPGYLPAAELASRLGI